MPAFGYGIQYKYGIFEQAFDKDGKQIEKPDYWLTNEEPWGHIDYNRSQKVSFGGEVVEENGKKVWKPAWSVRAVPVDYMVPGYASGRVNTLRLWSAKSYDEFDLLTFNKSEYLDAVKPQVEGREHLQDSLPGGFHPAGQGAASRTAVLLRGRVPARRHPRVLPRPGASPT